MRGIRARRPLAAALVPGAPAWALAAAPAAAQQSTLDPAGPPAREISELWWFMLAVSTVVVIVVAAVVLVAVLRRRGEERVSETGGRRLIVYGGVVIPMAILVGLFAFTLETLDETHASQDVPGLELEVVGHQWWWEFRYVGTGAVTANELHLPVGTTVRARVRTADVQHSFWVPQLNRKLDILPGRNEFITLHATREGVFRGQCAEYCGTQHGNMSLAVIAEPRERFERWLRETARPAREPASEPAERGRQVFFDAGCAGCHTIRGTRADGDLGPDLTHLQQRETLAGLMIPNSRGHLGGWVLDPQHIKPGNKMPGIRLGGEDFRALLAYLEGLE